jgi:hypothetical protein
MRDTRDMRDVLCDVMSVMDGGVPEEVYAIRDGVWDAVSEAIGVGLVSAVCEALWQVERS